MKIIIITLTLSAIALLLFACSPGERKKETASTSSSVNMDKLSNDIKQLLLKASLKNVQVKTFTADPSTVTTVCGPDTLSKEIHIIVFSGERKVEGKGLRDIGQMCVWNGKLYPVDTVAMNYWPQADGYMAPIKYDKGIVRGFIDTDGIVPPIQITAACR